MTELSAAVIGIIAGWFLHWLWGIWQTTEPYPPEEPKETPDITAAPTEFRKPKEKIQKIDKLKELLDEKLARGEITEAKYNELSEKYSRKANGMKNAIAETELLAEVGLIDTKQTADAIAGLGALGYSRHEVKEKIQRIDTNGMSAEQIIKAVLAMPQ
ncbi:Holliday junction ATP-dependent DNA helicase RuvA [uncultured archaeon]|nr:Holliday junction ATP-dependent DNA helicase RuvA [uncultured archaeon]